MALVHWMPPSPSRRRLGGDGNLCLWLNKFVSTILLIIDYVNLLVYVNLLSLLRDLLYVIWLRYMIWTLVPWMPPSPWKRRLGGAVTILYLLIILQYLMVQEILFLTAINMQQYLVVTLQRWWDAHFTPTNLWRKICVVVLHVVLALLALQLSLLINLQYLVYQLEHFIIFR